MIRSVIPCTPLPEHVVGHPERVDDRRLLLDHLEEAVVLDHDQRVDALAKLVDPTFRLVGAPAALEPERLRHDADRESIQLSRELGDDRRPAGAGAAALAGGHEDHVGALERLLQLVATLRRGRLADLRVRPGSEASRGLRPDVDLDVGVRHLERLGVGVHADELDARQTGVDHSVDGVRPAAAHPTTLITAR